MNAVDHDSVSTTSKTAGEDASVSPPFARCARWMTVAEQTLSAIFLLAIVGTMGAQVFARYFFGSPFSWSEEVARLALIWMTFLAASFVMAEGRHIAVDVLSASLGERGKLRLECLSHDIVAGTCLLLLFGGARFVWYISKVGSPSLGIPMGLWYGAVSFGLLLMSAHSIINLLQVIATGRPIQRENMLDEEALHLEMEPSE